MLRLCFAFAFALLFSLLGLLFDSDVIEILPIFSSLLLGYFEILLDQSID